MKKLSSNKQSVISKKKIQNIASYLESESIRQHEFIITQASLRHSKERAQIFVRGCTFMYACAAVPELSCFATFYILGVTHTHYNYTHLLLL